MPSKLKKAISAVKDRTSIGLARVSRSTTGGSSSSQLDLLVLKATTHDEIPVDERHIDDILILTSSSKPNAATCVQVVSRRIDRTRNWVVALKCLQLVYRALRDGGPFFPREALSAMRRGARLLNLSSFRDESAKSSPWDFSAFVRTFALYLDERLDCALLGKLQNRRAAAAGGIGDMMPPVILDRIAYWQRLLERAIATKPTGPARKNQLVHISLYSVVRESFDLYKDVSDGLALLLDGFFQLPHRTCVDAYHTCVRASKQFEELSGFYAQCQSVGVGRRSEYPAVQKISDALLRTLSDFIKVAKDSPSAKLNTMPPLQMLLLPSTSEEEEERNVSTSSKASVDCSCSPRVHRRSSVGSNGLSFDQMPGVATPRRTDSCLGRKPLISLGAASNMLPFDEMQMVTTNSIMPRRIESDAGRKLSISSNASSNQAPFDEMPERTQWRAIKRSESYGGRRLPPVSSAVTRTVSFDKMPMRRSGGIAGHMPTLSHLLSFGEMPNGEWGALGEVDDQKDHQQHTGLTLFEETPNVGPSVSDKNEDQWPSTEPGHGSPRLSCTITDLVLFEDHPVPSTASPSDEWQLVLVETANTISIQMEGTPSHSHQPAQAQKNPFLDDNTSNLVAWDPASLTTQPPPTFRDDSSSSTNTSLVVCKPLESASALPTFRADSDTDTTSLVLWDSAGPALGASPTFRADSGGDWCPAESSVLQPPPTFRAESGGDWRPPLVSSVLQPLPTFRARMPDVASVAVVGSTDTFSSQLDSLSETCGPVDVSERERVLWREQQMWLEQQRKIMASRNLAL